MEITQNGDFFQSTCFKECNNMAVENFYKEFLLVIIWNKKHLLNQIVPTTYTLNKKVFVAATFEGL